jgi:hypothetical protein
VEHLSQEELLLLADGELAEARAEHLGACAVCRSAAGAMQGQLTAITGQLRASALSETPESHSASWARLEDAIRGESEALSAHLLPEELLLHLDDELAPERALHLESCEDCHDGLLRVQALLFDIEHELRALMPPEPAERRRAAAAALEQRIYAAPRKVISFPVRWGVVYAAAAMLTFAVFGGLWTSRQPAPAVNEPSIAFQEPLRVEPPVPAPLESAEAPSPTAAIPQKPAAVVTVTQPEPERFVLAEKADSPAPSRPALRDSGVEVRVGPMTTRRLELAWAAPLALPAPPAATEETVAKRVERTVPVQDPEALLAGFLATARTGAWAAGITPEVRDGVLTFTGRVASPAERAEWVTAMRRELSGQDMAFDLAAANVAPIVEASEVSYDLGARPAGGMMRTALLTHYSDSARRSFQQPTQSALDAEIARFASEIYRSQSRLVRHAHALSELLQDFDTEKLSSEGSRSLDRLVRFHADGIATTEAQIYDHLSEALPRRYWNHRNDRESFSDADQTVAGKALLADALRLDETLTSLLGSSGGTIAADDVETSAGALLYRIRTRAKNLAAGLDRVR